MLRYVCVALLSLAVLYIPREWFFKFGSYSTPEPPLRLLSSRELSLYDGQEGSKGLYLAILGQVFDVHKGHKHYGPGGAYHFMAGNFYVMQCPYCVNVTPDSIKPQRDLSMVNRWAGQWFNIV